MKINIRKFILGLVIILVMAGTVLSPAVEAEQAQLDEEIKEYASMENFENILNIIQEYYVEEVEEERLLKGAIEGMLREVDRYSVYMTEEEYLEMQEEMEGEYGGIGIRITIRDGELTILSPISDTPGDEAGLKAEDVIAGIDGETTEDMTQQRAVDIMRGDPGTEVELTIERGDEEFEVDIVRELIDIPIVETETYPEMDIGYISVSQFLQETADKLSEAVKEMEEAGKRGLIIDLRNNPGGILQESVEVSSIFGDDEIVLSIKQRDDQEHVFRANPDRINTELPVVVLTNRGSASASEIVAGFIRDQDKGRLVGESTFGKGSVQSVFPLDDGSALRLTTAQYYTSGENPIYEDGLEPDYVVEYEDDPIEEEDLQMDKALEILSSYLEENSWPASEEFDLE